MLSSVDGKINSGSTDGLDVDADWIEIDGLKEGLQQYYDIEQTTDLFSFNTGRVLAKIGINDKSDIPQKSPVTFIIVDNKQHLKETGIKYLTAWLKRLIIVTTNSEYDTFDQDVDVVFYENEIDLNDLFARVKRDYGAENVTIQSGGAMNGALLRAKLIDYVNLVFAPVLVGGKDTPTLIDGESLTNKNELDQLGILKLLECKVLKESYINVKYEVIK
ncbi:MAG: dihydrofolate reductase family protein [Candidatus Nomurabacteria bacterium]|jgi:2,5-diamino-6-(ribosylamino)-4(3H)-pyrimidinone 5'-phosphate reductase|nr:dihydrofolate reductase family protein [Candidatus Nomurabacteria bacterium]